MRMSTHRVAADVGDDPDVSAATHRDVQRHAPLPPYGVVETTKRPVAAGETTC